MLAAVEIDAADCKLEQTCRGLSTSQRGFKFVPKKLIQKDSQDWNN